MAQTKAERNAKRRERDRLKRAQARQVKHFEKNTRPQPELNRAERVRLCRYLDAIADELEYWTEETKEDPPQWTLTWPIDAQMEDRYRDALSVIGFPVAESDGFLPKIGDVPYHMGRILSSNRIEFVATFATPTKHVFRIVERVACPIPCEKWGRFPLTVRQWRRIALPLILSECLWRFVHMVRDYTQDNRFNLYSVEGWYLCKPSKIKTDRRSDLWTNRVILSKLLRNYCGKRLSGKGQ